MRFNKKALHYKPKDSIFGMSIMASESTNSDVYAPNFSSWKNSGEALVACFILSLGPAGRKENTNYIDASEASSMTMFGMPSLNVNREF